MPSVEENLNYFQQYEWNRQGDEWSDSWGGPEAQWSAAIYPRIADLITAPSILEIAPGFGRWTQYLKDHCQNLTLVDLSARCIETCKQRFAALPHISYHVNDGKSLSMIPDGSIDFVFSFDSLVHVEADVMETYLDQIARKLTPDGAGFIHHSNMGAYPKLVFFLRRLPLRLRGLLMRKNILVNDGWRAHSMSATLFERLCEGTGLQCISQELVNWQSDLLTDCFSTFTLKSSSRARPNKVVQNPGFMVEAAAIKSKHPTIAKESTR